MAVQERIDREFVDVEWQAFAACRPLDPSWKPTGFLFRLEETVGPRAELSALVAPVAQQCLEYALVDGVTTSSESGAALVLARAGGSARLSGWLGLSAGEMRLTVAFLSR